MKDNILLSKSYSFALRIVKLYKFLSEEKNEYVLSKQVLRSGTSIGANAEEAIGGASKKDFHAKITIAYKETRETIYWLKLLRDAGFVTESQIVELLDEAEQLSKILGTIQKTIKKNSIIRHS